jgi:spore germination protein YaaH
MILVCNFKLFDHSVESLGLKYHMAKTMNLRGVGMWTADFLDYQNNPQESKEMWDAIRKFK